MMRNTTKEREIFNARKQIFTGRMQIRLGDLKARLSMKEGKVFKTECSDDGCSSPFPPFPPM